METLFEQEIAQNTALTAFAITQAAIRFAEAQGRRDRSLRGSARAAARLPPPYSGEPGPKTDDRRSIRSDDRRRS